MPRRDRHRVDPADVTRLTMPGLYKTMTEVSRQQLFSELFEAYYTKVLAYARRRVGADAASDVVAETFLAAWINLERLSGDPLPWLYSLARGATSHHLRSLARRTRLRGRIALRDPGSATPDHADTVGWEDTFDAAFRQLRGAEREVLRIVVWEGLSGRGGAAALGCSVTAFKVRLHRARRHLRRLLDIDEANQVSAVSPQQAVQPATAHGSALPSIRPSFADPAAAPLPRETL